MNLHLLRIWLLHALLVILLLPALCAQAAPPLKGITAEAAILMDAKTGEILWEKNASSQQPPASTTKIATAIVALDYGHLDDIVTVSYKAAATNGSSMHLGAGQKISLRDLLTGLLLRSGNDAAVAIAEHIAGSENNFVERMNARCLQIGALNSHFCNPHGLSRPNHYSSAFDLAWLTRYALQQPLFRELVRTKETTIDWKNNGDRNLRNTNRLLWILEGADGVKTGTTRQAGQCLVSSATRNQQQFIAVVLHSRNRWNDSARLLQYAFDWFELLQYAEKDQPLETLPVVSGVVDHIDVVPTKDIALVAETADIPRLSTKINLPETIDAPVHKGQKLGEYVIFKDSKAIRSYDLVADQDVPEQTWTRSILGHVTNGLRTLFFWGLL